MIRNDPATVQRLMNESKEYRKSLDEKVREALAANHQLSLQGVADTIGIKSNATLSASYMRYRRKRSKKKGDNEKI